MTKGEVAVMPVGYHDAITRAMADPKFDIEKLERLIAVQEARELREADHLFNEAQCAVQLELRIIAADASNPSTGTRYATYAALDREVRPVYAKHGFSVSYTTEPAPEPNAIMVVAMLSNGMVSRRYQMPIPIDTKGARGQDVMTRTHATMSAVTYGKRALLGMMFNLAVGYDDDGNKAGGGKPPPRAMRGAPSVRAVTPPEVPELHLLVETDEDGVVTERVTPFSIEWQSGDTPTLWGQKFVACLLHYCRARGDVDGFTDANHKQIERVQKESPAIYDLLCTRISEASAKLDQVKGSDTA